MEVFSRHLDRWVWGTYDGYLAHGLVLGAIVWWVAHEDPLTRWEGVGKGGGLQGVTTDMPQPERCAEEVAGIGQPETREDEYRRVCVLADSIWDRNEHCPLCLSTPSSLRSERETPGWRWTEKPDQQRGALVGGESTEVGSGRT